jgi:hypothetical protein
LERIVIDELSVQVQADAVFYLLHKVLQLSQFRFGQVLLVSAFVHAPRDKVANIVLCNVIQRLVKEPAGNERNRVRLFTVHHARPQHVAVHNVHHGRGTQRGFQWIARLQMPNKALEQNVKNTFQAAPDFHPPRHVLERRDRGGQQRGKAAKGTKDGFGKDATQFAQ